ncbi:MAG: asparaginase [Gaiellales bacterium]
MPDPISVQVTRGSVVEATHRVHAVAVDRSGAVVEAAGEVELVTYLRSSAKPLQALPLVRAWPDVPDDLVAIACASHLGRPEQLDAVRRLLALAGADERLLETGPEPSAIAHNCSGKHAGFIAVCRARGWDPHGYSELSHPLQQELLREVSETSRIPVAEIPVGVDGCGVPTFAMPLVATARLFGSIQARDGGARVAGAMRAHPELLRGPVAADAKLITELAGWIAKGGAEGLFCAATPDGLALALKVEDGSFRAIVPAVAVFLRRLGIDPGRLGPTPVVNSHGAAVGRISALS